MISGGNCPRKSALTMGGLCVDRSESDRGCCFLDFVMGGLMNTLMESKGACNVGVEDRKRVRR